MTVDEIYELVAMNIYNNIETDSWEKAILNIHGSNTAMGFDGYYCDNGKEITINVHKFDVDVEFALMELHEITTEGNSNQWNVAVFTLFPDGGFNMDFTYEPTLNED